MKINFYNDYSDEVYKNFSNYNWTGANGFCFNEKGEVAIVWETEKNYWTLPGGGKENNETPVETFVREVREETQCDIEIESIKYFHTVIAEEVNKDKKVGFRFICKLKNIEEFIPNKITNNFISEIDERKFVSLEDLPKYITWLGDTENGREELEILKKVLN